MSSCAMVRNVNFKAPSVLGIDCHRIRSVAISFFQKVAGSVSWSRFFCFCFFCSSVRGTIIELRCIVSFFRRTSC